MLKAIASYFTTIVILILSIFTPAIPEEKTVEELTKIPQYFHKYDIGENLYVIDSSVLDSNAKMHLAISLQGIVAKKKPCIYIKTNEVDNYYINEIKNNGVNIISTDENGKNWTLETLLNKFKNHISDSGYVLFRESPGAEGLNMATNLATVHGWLPVNEELEKIVVDAGLTLKEDFSEDEYNVFFQWKIFNKYKKLFNFNAVVHEHYNMRGLRDLAIQQGFFTFYVDDDEDGVWFRNYVLKFAGNNALVLGWAKYEVDYVTDASLNGNPVIPSDHCYNNSILTSVEIDLPTQKHTETKKYSDENKHYCALLFSDGDNIQWIQNGFSEYYNKLSLENDFPMTWTFPPLLQELSPLAYKRVYDDSDTNNYFIAGVSGAGYIHSSEYPYKALSEFTDITASSMIKSDLDYVTLLDTLPENQFKEARLIESLKYYSRYSNIKGGVVYLDPDRYSSGRGRVYFVDAKPFVTARFSLWHPSGNKEEVTKEWIEEQADIVNNYKSDIHSIDGYSVINIHPWSITIENLDYFVSLLDDDIILVTVDEMLEMIKENVPHKNDEVSENV